MARGLLLHYDTATLSPAQADALLATALQAVLSSASHGAAEAKPRKPANAPAPRRARPSRK